MLAVGCAPGEVVHLEPPWPAGQSAIVIVLGEDGAPLGAHLVRNHALTNVVLTGEARVYARTYDALVEPLDGCRPVAGGGDGLDLGEPRAAWRSEGPPVAGRLALFEERPPRELPIRLVDCLTPPRSCEVTTHLVVAPPSHRGFRGVAVVSDDRAIAGGEIASESDSRTPFIRISGATTSALPSSDNLRGGIAGLDRSEDRIVGAAGAVVFTMGLDGTLTSTSVNDFSVVALDTGADGTTFFVGAEAQIAILAPGETTPSRIESPPLSFTPTPDIPDIAAHGRDRAVLAAPDRTAWLYEGSGWRRLLEQVEDDIDAVAIDDRYVLIDFNVNPTVLLDPSSGDYAAIEGVSAYNWIAATASRDGRFLLVGQRGQTAYYNGDRFCLIAPATPDNLTDVDFSPSLGIAYAVGENMEAGLVPPIVRMQLPVDR